MESHNVSHPAHLPCPDMAGCADPDPAKRQQSRRIVAALRQTLTASRRELRTVARSSRKAAREVRLSCDFESAVRHITGGTA